MTSHADRIGTAADAFAAEYLTRVPSEWRDRLAVYLQVRWSKSLACSIARRRGGRRGFGISSNARPKSSPHSEFPVLLTADAHHPARVAIVEPKLARRCQDRVCAASPGTLIACG